MTRRWVACPGVSEPENGRLCNIKHQLKPTIKSVSAGMRDKVTTNQELFSVGVLVNQPTEEVRVWTETVLSPHNGEITRLSINKSLCIRPGQAMMVIEYCPQRDAVQRSLRLLRRRPHAHRQDAPQVDGRLKAPACAHGLEARTV